MAAGIWRVIKILFAVWLVWTVAWAGCGISRTKGTSLPGQGRALPPTFALRTAPPGSAGSGALPESGSRIVVAECTVSNPGELVLDLIDPTGQQPTQYRAFAVSTPGMRFAASCGSTRQTPMQRSSFNADFTQLAAVVTSSEDGSGSSQVVVVRGSALSTTRPASASGDSTSVTALAPDASDTAAYAGAVFGPDGRVYFMRIIANRNQHVQSVSPTDGTGNLRDEPTPANMQANGDGQLYFPPGCKLPQETVTSGGACSPDGELEVAGGTFGPQPQLRAGDGSPYTLQSGGNPSTVWPFAAIDNQQFLAGDNGFGLYRIAQSGSSAFMLTRLVTMPGGLSANDPTLSPDHRTVAFMGRTGQIAQVCVVPATGGTPVAVMQYGIGHNKLNPTLAAHVLGWVG